VPDRAVTRPPETLAAAMPGAGLLPRTIGGVTLTEPPLARLTTLAPFLGRSEALSAALEAAHGLPLPGPNRMSAAGDASCAFHGRALWLLAGPAPDARLAEHAALTDQTDAWATVDVTGPEGPALLARLVPVDLRPAAFPEGAAIRTEVQHMQAAITRPAPGVLRIRCFRSMARTLIHDLTTAAEALAARAVT